MASTGIIQQFAAIWRQIGINQRLSIVLVGLGSIAAVAGMVYWGGRPNFGLLYSGLSRKDAAAVVAQLETEAIPYRLEDNGTTVLVSTEQIQKARGKLLTQGIPAGGDGFEILDKHVLGTTDFSERKTFLRAVQGELARTIGCIEGIEWARVHISAPEPSVFLEKDRPTTASVLVKTRGSARLNPTQVASIASLVARSVEGLEPKNVTITDQFLNPLSKGVSDDGPAAPTAHLDAQREVEHNIARKVQDLLDTSLGQGRSAVSVSADIALKAEEHRIKQFEKEGRVAKREKTTNSKTTGGEGGSGGPAGAASNLPGGAQPSPATASARTSTDTNEEIDYEVPVKEIIKHDRGVTVKRITVSVLVAGTHSVERDKDGKETGKKFQPVPEASLAKLTDAVKQAAGYDTQRGDQVKVDCVEFNEPEPAVSAAEVAKERQWDFILRAAKHGSTVVIVLGFLITMRFMLRRARAAREAAARQVRPVGGGGAAAAAPTAGNLPLPERVAAAVKGNPDGASELLKSWYKEGAART